MLKNLVREGRRSMTKHPFRLPIILFLLWPSIGWGMEASLTQVQIEEAIAKGKKFGKLWRWDFDPYGDPVGKFFNQYEFGDRSTCNYGHVYTRFNQVVSASMAATKKNEEIPWYLLRELVVEKSFAITINTCHEVSENVFDNQVFLKQSGNTIQPKLINQHKRSSGGIYVIVYFFFNQLDPRKEATLVVVEDSEHEFEHNIDFSLMP